MNNCSWYSSSYTCSTSTTSVIIFSGYRLYSTAPSCFACSHFPPSLMLCIFSLICLSHYSFPVIPFKAKTLSLSTRVSLYRPCCTCIQHALYLITWIPSFIGDLSLSSAKNKESVPHRPPLPGQRVSSFLLAGSNSGPVFGFDFGGISTVLH
jgi:hypothetical protein